MPVLFGESRKGLLAAHRAIAKRQGITEGLRSALSRNSVRGVAVVFVLLLAVLLPLELFSGGWSGWGPITRTVAATAGALSRIVGIDATVDGNIIRLQSRNLAVDPECTAVDLLAIFAALVLAYPLRWTRKLFALATGGIVIELVNIGRLVGVAWASETLGDNQFHVLHDYLFEFGMVFLVMMIWAVWLSLAGGTHNRYIVRFIAATVAVSLLLGVPLLVVGSKTSSMLALGLTTILMASVPAWSMIAAAVGAPARRKLLFSLVLLAFTLAFGVFAFLTGWQQLASASVVIESVRSELLVAAYQLALVSGPVVALVLFAGKRPWVFWMAERE